ncbi:MAG: nucleotidyltransferase family protein [Armatimonadetes bacterium]|nr:nucleotidyltransferase family protein [Armatimonadota bacterium]
MRAPENLGFEAVAWAGDRDHTWALRDGYHLRLLPREPGCWLPIEVHWGLGDAHRHGLVPDANVVWEDARQITVAGARVAVPSPEVSLVYACVHWAAEGYIRLLELVDIRALIGNGKDAIDWDRFVELVRRWRLEAPCVISRSSVRWWRSRPRRPAGYSRARG